jgi:hypothetical protein
MKLLCSIHTLTETTIGTAPVPDLMSVFHPLLPFSRIGFSFRAASGPRAALR